MRKSTKEYCQRIAKLYGADLKWVSCKHTGIVGYYIPGTNKIRVDKNCTDSQTASVFSHELGHYLNFLNKKYFKYHKYRGRGFTKRFKTKHRAIRYALDAELYTDKVGKKLCKQWFPNVKYLGYYKDNKQCYNSLYNNYFGFHHIIILLTERNKNGR